MNFASAKITALSYDMVLVTLPPVSIPIAPCLCLVLCIPTRASMTGPSSLPFLISDATLFRQQYLACTAHTNFAVTPYSNHPASGEHAILGIQGAALQTEAYIGIGLLQRLPRPCGRTLYRFVIRLGLFVNPCRDLYCDDRGVGPYQFYSILNSGNFRRILRTYRELFRAYRK